MSTDYTHLSKLSFDQLFARKGPNQEVQVMDADGNLSGIGSITTTGTLSVTSIITTGTIAAGGNVTGANLSGTNTGNVTLGTANGLVLVGQALSMTAASSAATGVLTTSAQSIAGAKTFTGAIAASNFSGTHSGTSSGTNTGDQTITLSGDVSGSGTGAITTAIGTNKVANTQLAQMAATTIKGNSTAGLANAADLTTAQVKTLLNLTGTNSGDVTIGTANGLSLSTQQLSMAAASSSTIGVVTTGAQSLAGAKTFTSTIAASNFSGTHSGTSSGTNSGDVTIGTANGLSLASQAISMAAASSSATGVINATTQSFGGIKTFQSGAVIKGDATGGAASTGYVGEYVSSLITTATNCAATTAYSDLTSISLTAGDWTLDAGVDFIINGATITAVEMGISSTSGNSSTGLNPGDNSTQDAPPTAAYRKGVLVSGFVVRPSSTTIYYLKIRAVYSAGTPQARGRIGARRMR